MVLLMQKEYLDRLANFNRILVEQIEKFSGVEIIVIVDRKRKDTLACEMDENGAKILIPTPEYFADDSVVHELLHIQRLLCSGVPRIIVCEDYDNCNPNLKTSLLNLDNILEHLVIVPEELEHFPENRAYWEAVFHRELDRIQSANLSDDERELAALIYWVFIKHVLQNQDLINKANKLIEYLGANDRAIRFFENIVASLHSKERTVKLCFEHPSLKHLCEAVCLEYIDSQKNIRQEIPLIIV